MTNRLTLSVAVLASFAAPLTADETEDSYKVLFGNRFEQAVASATAADDLALATEMLDTARKLATLPNLQAMLWDKAFQLTINQPDGLDTAAAAMTLLAEHAPGRAAEANDRLIDVRQKMFVRAKPDKRVAAGQALIELLSRTADAHLDRGESSAAAALYRRASAVAVQIKSDAAPEIKAKLDASAAAERIEKQVDLLRTRVLEHATDHESAAQLVRLLVIDMDKPAQAQPYANHLKDEDLKKHMILAARPVDELTEAETQSLGAWYRTQGMQAREPRIKAAALTRAAQLFERFLTLHKADDLQRSSATMALEGVKKDLAGLEEGAVPRGFKGSDLAAEFPTGKSPDGKVNAGPWAFGWAPANKLGEFTPYEKLTAVPAASIIIAGKAELPAVWRNLGKGESYGVAPGEVSLHGGPNQEMSIARWTSPWTGKVHLTGAFGAGHGGTVDVYIAKVSRGEVTVLFKKPATAATEPFDLVHPVRAGDKLDFIVGTAGSHSSDNTPLNLRIMPAKAESRPGSTK